MCVCVYIYIYTHTHYAHLRRNASCASYKMGAKHTQSTIEREGRKRGSERERERDRVTEKTKAQEAQQTGATRCRRMMHQPVGPQVQGRKDAESRQNGPKGLRVPENKTFKTPTPLTARNPHKPYENRPLGHENRSAWVFRMAWLLQHEKLRP